MDYVDFTLEASGITELENPKRLRYAVRVLEEMAQEEAVTITASSRICCACSSASRIGNSPRTT